ncbi:MAG: bifunctional hydroxymethylpyrimidine kinase/phosphomethylpyrimidine kinase [Aquabacterium sp.]|uniref:bifunctional hydroxymethylpyrimidine kinase/phosphomethylpyrimidine kinase n=1 Tax=Aquabacterium sp. TaxID=1872578 RepID=UPI0025BEE95C|nr:bifunctional hydroxymethylpyrimidine kinase/phosphomethylpyrimidine kinase [Aquabacterium sp.]MBI5924277.1 bifunctional hydroxymethylpyrimidine kinase/phosphomethylpyrimidine kinase [Aquabacterium sp.]
MTDTSPLPVIWSIAGHDSGGGAGLSADQRAADAMGVHLCPVVASVTAQNSTGVQAVYPLSPSQLDAQLKALAQDMPPAAIKTGLLGDAVLIEVVAGWVRQLRERTPDLPLVVDPVLGASAGGAAFCNDEILWAYRRHLLPLATLITPNRAEACRLLGRPGRHDGPQHDQPDLALRLRELGARNVVITGGDAPSPDWALDWMDAAPHAHGWLCNRRVATRHHHGSGCTFAAAATSALALGHVCADAIVLAKMVTTQALQRAHVAGEGPGPVMASSGQALGPLPWLGIGRALPWQLTHGDGTDTPLFKPFEPPADGLYGILPDSERLSAAADAGLQCLQLRHKTLEGAAAHMSASAHACAQHGALLFINDHWQQALSMPVQPGLRLGIHLGQEDLLALDESGCQPLLNARERVVLGLSSHSPWELARAAGCGASLIACGPVLPTSTKDMPWVPQGADNLQWWVAHSPAPVVAIGGLLTPQDVARFAASGAAALCLVRGLGDSAEAMRATLPVLRQAASKGRIRVSPPSDRLQLPHPVL